jgi:GTP-binding protein
MGDFFTLEQSISFFREHELVEVTPRSVHMRKAVLSAQKHHNLRSAKVKKNMPMC